jgi:ABC-type multidrug transport system ATPase subunit
VTFTFAAEGLWKSFGRRPVLRNASLWGEAGRVTVLFGRNGSGKTTLVRAALGLIRADTGVVLFGGHRYRRPTLPALAADGLFFLPDRDLFADTVTLRGHFDAVAHRFPAVRGDDAAGALGIVELLDRRAFTLSGGERRRAEVALVEARRPLALIADEPFRGIAPRDAELVAARLRGLAEGGCAVMVTGHETRVLLALADRVIWMTGGTTHALGTAAEARSHEQFRREYLGSGAHAARRDATPAG